MKNLDKDYKLLQNQLNKQEFAFKHHAKIMEKLRTMGFVPKPEQMIIVEPPKPVNNIYGDLENYRGSAQ